MTIWSSGVSLSDWDDGWFQKNLAYNQSTGLQNWTVFRCINLIAGDIGKLTPRFLERHSSGVWIPAATDYDRLLFRPNGYQTWQQFIEAWAISKQRRGNTYALMQRDRSTRVVAMHVLDPDRVTPLVAKSGDVYYRLQGDELAQVPDGGDVAIADDIMHDRFNCLFHPLVGISPLWCGSQAALQGLEIIRNSSRFFRNGSRPGGILISPGEIDDEYAKEMKAKWEANYGGANAGRTAVLGGGLKYEPIAQDAVDSDLVAQLKMSDQIICRSFGVPAYKVGVNDTAVQATAEQQNQGYYDDCLQTLIEAIEGLFDRGLGLPNVNGRTLRMNLNVEDLLRMDGGRRVEKLKNEVSAAIASPDEARAELGRLPVEGGASPYLQQQNFSLAALAKRDARDDPFASAKPANQPAANDPTVEAANEKSIEAEAREALA